MPSLARLHWLRMTPARTSMSGRSTAWMHVKRIHDNSVSPSRPDQYPVLPLIQAVVHQERNGGVFKIPVAAAEHRSPPRGLREPFDRARGALCAPGELGERRGGREAQEGVGGAGVSFLLVTFLWTSKEKSPAVGQPPTSCFSSSPKAIQKKTGFPPSRE